MTPQDRRDPDRTLTLTGITKRYGETLALNEASFSLRRRSVHALLGENGAGKSTLMRVAFGLVQPDRGAVSVAGHAGPIRSAPDAISAGLGMVHQHFTNIPAMTVAENIALGNRGVYRLDAARRRVADIASRTGLPIDPDSRVADLSVGAQQRLEILKALATNARILILDEPTAVLAPRESDELLRWLRTFADSGNAVVLITHKLREALAIADDVTVLRRGRTVLAEDAAALTATALTEAMLGEDLEPSFTAPFHTPGVRIASAEQVTMTDDRGVIVVQDATFVVRQGEIVGIAAVEGAGQRELLRAMAARAEITSGRMQRPHSVAFVPEDRQRDALALDFSVSENIALRGAGERKGVMSWSILRAQSEKLVVDYDIRGASPLTRRSVRTLSGGNQQKLVLARELEGRPSLVIAENPTRGLDIRAASAVHDRLRAAAAAGCGVVVYSSDLDEVLSLATRLLVMHAGTIRECSFDRGEIGRAMLGVA